MSASFGGEEHRDDQDRDDVVEDREGQDEDAQLVRQSLAEHREHAERERDVGRRRDRPAALVTRSRGEGDVDQGGHDDAPGRRDGGADGFADAVQLPGDHLVLELDGDDEEEDREQPVADPVADREVERGSRHREVH
jgi:hypothetical protein